MIAAMIAGDPNRANQTPGFVKAQGGSCNATTSCRITDSQEILGKFHGFESSVYLDLTSS
jgi:hypothetical protein